RASSAIASSLGFTRITPFVGRAKARLRRAHLHPCATMVAGTAQARLCPPYPTISMRAQFAFTLDHFGCELEIGFAADTFEIVHQHRLAIGRRLGDAHIARDHGLVDLGAHE